MLQQFADIAKVGYWPIVPFQYSRPGFLRRGLTRALLKDSRKMPTLSELLMISAINGIIDGRIYFNRLVGTGMRSQFLLGVDWMIL